MNNRKCDVIWKISLILSLIGTIFADHSKHQYITISLGTITLVIIFYLAGFNRNSNG